MPSPGPLTAQIQQAEITDSLPPTADFRISQGLLIFQRRPLLLLHAAELNGKYGNPAEARTMAEFGIKLSRTPEARQAFEEVLAALPPAAGVSR